MNSTRLSIGQNRRLPRSTVVLLSRESLEPQVHCCVLRFPQRRSSTGVCASTIANNWHSLNLSAHCVKPFSGVGCTGPGFRRLSIAPSTPRWLSLAARASEYPSGLLQASQDGDAQLPHILHGLMWAASGKGGAAVVRPGGVRRRFARPVWSGHRSGIKGPPLILRNEYGLVANRVTVIAAELPENARMGATAVFW